MDLTDLVVGCGIIAAGVSAASFLITSYELYEEGHSPTWRHSMKCLWFPLSRVDIRDLYKLLKDPLTYGEELERKYLPAARKYLGEETFS